MMNHHGDYQFVFSMSITDPDRHTISVSRGGPGFASLSLAGMVRAASGLLPFSAHSLLADALCDMAEDIQSDGEEDWGEQIGAKWDAVFDAIRIVQEAEEARRRAWSEARKAKNVKGVQP